MEPRGKSIGDKEPAGTVLTITMLGTNEHRNHDKSILTEFHNAITTGPRQYKLLIDGIGAGPLRDPEHPRLGGYIISTPTIDREQGRINYQKIPRWLYQIPNKILAIIKGTGMDASIDESLTVIEQLLKHAQENNAMPLTLNLVGFSRGADTVRRLCNELNIRYQKEVVKVNLFALDPVPGPMRHDATRARLLPSNVEYSEVIQMRDDPRLLFAVQDKQHTVVQNPNTEHVYRLYPGVHSSGKFFYYGDKQEGNINLTDVDMRNMPTPIMVGDDLAKFAKRCGTALDENKFHYINYSSDHVSRAWQYEALTTTDRLIHYSKMSLDKSRIHSHKNQAKRAFTDYETDYFMHGSGYFIDKSHMDLFRQNYPHVFDYYFQQHQEFKDDPANWQKLKDELAAIKKHPNIARSLCRYLGIEHLPTTIINDHGTRGIHLIASDFYQPQNRLMMLWESIQFITHPVLCGLDKRTHKELANDLYSDVREVLMGKQSAREKERAITSILESSLRSPQKKSVRFKYKVTSLLQSLGIEPVFKKATMLPAIDMLHALIKNAGEAASTNLYIKIMQSTLDALKQVYYSTITNKPAAYTAILENAVSAAGQLVTLGYLPGKMNYISRMRECLLSTSVRTMPTDPSPGEKIRYDDILKQQRQSLAEIVQEAKPKQIPPRIKVETPMLKQLQNITTTLREINTLLETMQNAIQNSPKLTRVTDVPNSFFDTQPKPSTSHPAIFTPGPPKKSNG